MTFEQWFDKTYPEGSLGPVVIRLSFKEVAEKAWNAGYSEGGSAQVEWQDYLDRMDD